MKINMLNSISTTSKPKRDTYKHTPSSSRGPKTAIESMLREVVVHPGNVSSCPMQLLKTKKIILPKKFSSNIVFASSPV